jgi:hypothetical protein
MAEWSWALKPGRRRRDWSTTREGVFDYYGMRARRWSPDPAADVTEGLPTQARDWRPTVGRRRSRETRAERGAREMLLRSCMHLLTGYLMNSFRTVSTVVLIAFNMGCTNANIGSLSDDDERIVREAVYDGELAITSPPDAPFHSMLVVPPTLSEVYKKHPQQVVTLLQAIIEGGSPRDSSFAAGCALSLISGHAGAGAVCVENLDKKTYDRKDVAWNTTPRKHWASRVESMAKEMFSKK